jgi:hypothetical protein
MVKTGTGLVKHKKSNSYSKWDGIKWERVSRLLKGLVFLCLFSCFFPPFGADAKNNPEEDFDELLIYVSLSKYGGKEIPAAIRDEKVYLSLSDLFDFLQIKNGQSDNEMIQGYILNQHDTFTLDYQNGKLTYKEKEHAFPPSSLIKQDDLIYLRSDLFGEIFGLNCSFDFRSLSVALTTQLDLPVFRQMRQEMMRKNLNKLHGTLEADTVYARKKSMAKLQMADWAVSDTRQITSAGGERQVSGMANMTRFNLSLGGEFAHGEVVAHLNVYEGMPLQHRNQFYQWRHVNNDNQLVRQVSAGRINTQSTSTILAPIIGLQVTNASTLRRKSFGSYRITDHTESEWLVELYVNNTLIDFVRADAAGLYTFDVPLIYGNTNIQLKFYGPYGEEHTREQFINIPFNFLPKKELEYTLSAGKVDDEWGNLFSRGSFNYGLSGRVTVGGGVEHLSTLPGKTILPFVQSSVKVSNGILFSGDYMPGVRTRALLNYRNLDISYTRLDKDQKAIVFNYLEERKIALNMPIRKNNFSLFSRLSLTQMVYPNGKFTNAQLLLSGQILGIPTNLTTFGVIRNQQANLHSMVSQTYRLPRNISFMPQVQYNYTAHKVSNVMLRLEKRVSRKGFFNLFYQNNFMFQNYSLGIGFRYDFSFSNMSMQARQSNGQVTLTQTARGSMMYDGNTGHMDFNNKVNVGKGAITVLPFLDLNANGKKDKHETLVSGLKLKVKGGQVQYDKNGESIRITNLTPYEDYILELDKSSFDNIAWRMKNTVVKVRVDPNQFKKIEIPISVMGEAAGMVYFGEGLNGIGRIKMNFYDDRDNFIHSTLTESDGYFSYMELAPGIYRVMPDSVQMQQLGYTFQSGKTTFTITENEEGDYLDDLEFTLHELIPEPAIQDFLHTVKPIYSGELKEEIDWKGEFPSVEKREISVENPKEDREKNGNIPPANSSEAPIQSELSVQDENIDMDGLKEKRRQAVSPPDSMNALRFTLKNSNPALLQNLIGKGLEEQKQAVKSLVEKPAVLPDGSPSGTKGRPREDTALLATGVIYKIQILASELEVPLDHPYYKGIPNISEEYHDGFYKYTHLPTSSPTEAQENLKKMNSLGFKDAFVAEYKEGRRLEYGKSTKSAPTDGIIGRTHPDTHFKIQIRSSDEMLSHDDPVFKGVKEIDFYIHKGQYKYTYGVALNYQEAVVLLGQVRSLGFDDAFIVSFYKKRRLE